jgi:hypothetical protein
MPMNKPDVAAERVLNPLWIISLFLGITEITVGAVATQVTSWIQGLFAIFAVAFPATVAAAFFTTLWKKPYVFYAPRDFPKHLDVQAYVAAMRSATIATRQELEVAVDAAVESAVRQRLPPDVTAAEAATEIEAAVATVREEYRKSLVIVDLREFPGPPDEVALPASEHTRTSDLLNQIWFYLEDFVEPFTYGQAWVLEVLETGRILFPAMQLGRAEQLEFNIADHSVLGDHGLGAGSVLRALDRRSVRTLAETITYPRAAG